MKQVKGTVKSYHRRRGMGYIVPDGGGDDVMIHHTQLTGVKELFPGNRVLFEIEKHPKGLRAKNLRRINIP